MSNHTELVEHYERIINEADRDDQLAAAREAVAADVTFVGPLAGEVAGREALVDTMRAMRERVPADGIQIRRTTPVDEHNGWLRYGWEFTDADDRIVMRGLDVARLADDGRLATVVAFVDEAPGADDASSDRTSAATVVRRRVPLAARGRAGARRCPDPAGGPPRPRRPRPPRP